MKNIFCAIFTFSLIIAEIEGDIPGCDYFDTVDLTNIPQLRNGSFQYEGIIIPKEKTAIFNYKIFLDGKKEVVPYIRGCVCHIKPCLIFCCNPPKSLEYQPLNITLLNGQVVQKDLLMDYLVQLVYEDECEALTESDTKNTWSLFENDVLYVHGDNESFTKQQYCLFPLKGENNNTDYKLTIKLTLSVPVNKLTLTPDQAVRTVSVFCMVLTIAIFLYVRKYQTTYNRCCICYFSCLTIILFLALVESIINATYDFTYELCLAFAYAYYFFFMVTFLWLIMINLTLWKSFKNPGRSMERHMFMNYSIIVWSIAVVLLTLCLVADRYLIEKVPDHLRPEMAQYTCLVKTTDMALMIYFNSLISVAILINILIFVATTRIINVENECNQRNGIVIDSKKNVENSMKIMENHANFAQFIRLFIMTGCLWFIEIVSSLLTKDNRNVSSYLNFVPSSQGVILFFITVVRKSMIKSIYERMQFGKSKPPISQEPKTVEDS